MASALALLLGACAAALAFASSGRARQLGWAACAAVATALAVRVLGGALPFFDLRHLPAIEGLRAALGAPLARLLPEPEAGLALGIVLGERSGVGPELAAAFNATGTTHLLAISGYNLTLVAAAVTVVLRARAGPVGAALASFTAVGGYSVLVGLQPSVLRAMLMAATATLALSRGRHGSSANALAAAATVMLLAEPRAIVDAGALLSVAATAGLILWQRDLVARLAFLPAFVREGVATTLAASLPTLPLVALLFGRVSLIAPLANLLAVPLFTPLLALGAATSLVGSVSLAAAWPLALATYLCAALLRRTVELLARVPAASLDLPAGPFTGAIVALLLLGAVVAVRRGRAGLPHLRIGRPSPVPAACVAAMLAAAAVLTALSAARQEPAGVRVLALDVGQGDAYLVEADGRLALIDGGPDPARLLAELGASLPPWRRRIDLVALTHAHLDHGAGLLAVLDRYDIGLAIAPAGLNEGPLRTAWLSRIARGGAAHATVRAGDRVRLGGATIRVLAPDGDPRVDVPSLALRLEYGAFSMLFMGDATDAALANLLLAPQALAARVYVPPHHGAATPFGAALVGAVRPEAAVLSVGAGNRYGHPTPETLSALGGIATYRTDRDGTVEIRGDGKRISVRTHANALPPPRRGFVPYAPAPR